MAEMKALYTFCQANHLLLYADGARLGAAIMSKASGLSLKDMYRFTDAFFIGGTKNGALLGEALVIKNCDVKAEYRYLIKQRGALLAKGWILGIQFKTLFTDNLFFDLAAHANGMARRLALELEQAGCTFLIDSPTNQIFPVMENRVIQVLSEQFSFYTWSTVDENLSAVRLITSWATSEGAVRNFLDAYRKASGK